MATSKSSQQAVILNGAVKCNFCKYSKNDKFKYGPLYKLKHIKAHYYCVLMSSRIQQNGEDNEGILGFLLNDIKNALKESSNKKCYLCNQFNATVFCASKSCKRIYHFPCGLKAGNLFQFYDKYDSFCHKHRKFQTIPSQIWSDAKKDIVNCGICYEILDLNKKINFLWAPCCSKTFFHKKCIQKMALSAGYFFKCPICNNTGKFVKQMLKFGIFVPKKDASWELEPNAFHDLLFRYSKCDADVCKCPSGRNTNKDSTTWEIVLCDSCGSQGIHKACGNLKFSDPLWECSFCENVTQHLPLKSSEKSNYKISSYVSQSQVRCKKRKRGKQVCDDLENSGLDKRKRMKMSESSYAEESVGSSKDLYKGNYNTRIKNFKKKRNKIISHNGGNANDDEENEEFIDVESLDSTKATNARVLVKALTKIKPGPLSYKLKVIQNSVQSEPSVSSPKSEEKNTSGCSSVLENVKLDKSHRNNETSQKTENNLAAVKKESCCKNKVDTCGELLKKNLKNHETGDIKNVIEKCEPKCENFNQSVELEFLTDKFDLEENEKNSDVADLTKFDISEKKNTVAVVDISKPIEVTLDDDDGDNSEIEVIYLSTRQIFIDDLNPKILIVLSDDEDSEKPTELSVEDRGKHKTSKNVDSNNSDDEIVEILPEKIFRK